MTTAAHTNASKVMLITGGGRGIGAATAKLASAQGYAVVINYQHQRVPAEQVAADREMREQQRVLEQQADAPRLRRCRGDVDSEREQKPLERTLLML